MIHEGILARMGRLLAAIASETIDKVEDSNKVALVEQAIREIDAGADEARHALGKSRAEEFRISAGARSWTTKSRRSTDKIRSRLRKTARISRTPASRGRSISNRRAPRSNARGRGRARNRREAKAMQAMLGARRDAEARLADLEASSKSIAAGDRTRDWRGSTKPDRAMAAIARVTGVPAAGGPATGTR